MSNESSPRPPRINYASLRYVPGNRDRSYPQSDYLDTHFREHGGFYAITTSENDSVFVVKNWAHDELYLNIPNQLNEALYREQEQAMKKRTTITPVHLETAFLVMDAITSNFNRSPPNPAEVKSYIDNLGHVLAYCHYAKMKATPQMVAHARSIQRRIKSTRSLKDYSSFCQVLDTWCIEMEMLSVTDKLASFMSNAGKAVGTAAHDATAGVVGGLTGAAANSLSSLNEFARGVTVSAVKPFHHAATGARSGMSEAAKSARAAIQSAAQSRPSTHRRATPLPTEATTQAETKRPVKRKRRPSGIPRPFNTVPPPSPHRHHKEQEILSIKYNLLKEFEKNKRNPKEGLALDKAATELILREYWSSKRRTKFDMAVITAALANTFMQHKLVAQENAKIINDICSDRGSKTDIIDGHGNIDEARLLELARGYMQLGRGPIIAEVPIISKESIKEKPIKLDEEANRQIEALHKQMIEVERALIELRSHTEIQDPGAIMVENVRNLFTPDQLKAIFGSTENLNELIDTWGTLSLEEQSTLINISKNDDVETVKEHASGRIHFTGTFTQVRAELFNPPRNKADSRNPSGIVTIFSIADHPGRIDRYDKSEIMRDEKARFTTNILPALQTLSSSFPEFSGFIPILQHELSGSKNMYQAFYDAKKRFVQENGADEWERIKTIAHATTFLSGLAGGRYHIAYQGTATEADGTFRIKAHDVYPTTVFAAVYREKADPNILTTYDLEAQEKLYNLLLGKTAIVGPNGSGKSVLQATNLGAYIGLPIFVENSGDVVTKINLPDHPAIKTNMLAISEAPHSTGQTNVRRLITALVDQIVASDEAGSGLPHAGQLACAVALGNHTYGSQILHDGLTYARIMQAFNPETFNKTDFFTMQDYRPTEGLIASSEGVGVLAACIPSTNYLQALNTKIREQTGSDIKGLDVYMQIAGFLEKQEGKKAQPFQTKSDLETAGISDIEVDRQHSALNTMMIGAIDEALNQGPFFQSASLLLQKRSSDLLTFLTNTQTTPEHSEARGEILSACLSSDRIHTLNAFRLAGLADAVVNAGDYTHAAALITDINNNFPSVKDMQDFNRLLANNAYLCPEAKKLVGDLPRLLERAKKIGSTRVRDTVDYQQIQTALLDELRGNCQRLLNDAITPKDYELVTEVNELREKKRRLENERAPEPSNMTAVLKQLLLTHIDPEKQERVYQLFESDMITAKNIGKLPNANSHLPRMTKLFWSLAKDPAVVKAMAVPYGTGNQDIMDSLIHDNYVREIPKGEQISLDDINLTTEEKAFLLAGITMVFNYHAQGLGGFPPQEWRGWGEPGLNKPNHEIKIYIDHIYRALDNQELPKDLQSHSAQINALKNTINANTIDDRYPNQEKKLQQLQTLKQRISQSTNSTILPLLNEILAIAPSLAADPYKKIVITESQQMAQVCNTQNVQAFWQQFSNAVNNHELSRRKISDNPTFSELVSAAGYIGGNYGEIIQAIVVIGAQKMLQTGLSDENVTRISSDLNNVTGLLTYANTLRMNKAWCKAEVKKGAGLQIKGGVNLATAARNVINSSGRNTEKLQSGLDNFHKINMTITPGCSTLTGSVGVGKTTSLNLISQIMGLAHANGGIVPAEQFIMDTFTTAKSMAISDTASRVSRFTANSESIADLTLWISSQDENSKPLIILDEPGLGTDAAGRRLIVTTMVKKIYEKFPDAVIVLVTHETGIANDLKESIPNVSMLGINPETKEIVNTGHFNESNPFDPQYVGAAVTEKLLSMGISQAIITKNLPVILKYLGDLYTFNVHLDNLQHQTATTRSSN